MAAKFMTMGLHPLVRAALQRGDAQRVGEYLKGGGNPHATDQRGRTPLILAAAKGHNSICRTLLEYGADKHALDMIGTSAADAARQAGFISTADLIDSFGSGQTARLHVKEIAPSDQGYANAWLAEDDVDAPLDNPAVRIEATRLHKDISCHPVRNTDATWEDVSVELPQSPAEAASLVPGSETSREIFSVLVSCAVEEGSFSVDLIDAMSAELGWPDDPETARRLMQVMHDLGAVAVDGGSEWLALSRLSVNDRVDADVEQEWDYLQDLMSSLNDPQLHLAREIERSVLLDREGEENLGRLLNLAIVSATLAIAADNDALAVVVDLAEAIVLEPGLARGICRYSNDDDGADAAPDVEVLAARIAVVADASRESPDKRAARVKAALEDLQLTLHGTEVLLKRLRAKGFENDDLEAAISRGKRVQQELFAANLRLAVSVAKTYGWSELPEMDRVQEAFAGLLTAVARFDARRGFKFSTYATWWLRQAVTRAIADKARLIRVPVHALEKLNKMTAAAREGEFDSVREAPISYLVETTGFSSDEVEKLLAAPDDALSWSSSEDLFAEVMSVESELEGPVAFAERVHMESALDLDIDELPGRQGPVLRHRFGMSTGVEMTLEEVGKEFGVTRERIRQIEAQALRRLRHPERRIAAYHPSLEMQGELE